MYILKQFVKKFRSLKYSLVVQNGPAACVKRASRYMCMPFYYFCVFYLFFLVFRFRFRFRVFWKLSLKKKGATCNVGKLEKKKKFATSSGWAINFILFF